MAPSQSHQPRRTLEFRSPAFRNAEPARKERNEHRSGFFPTVDEFAGLERLDRDELDDVDE